MSIWECLSTTPSKPKDKKELRGTFEGLKSKAATISYRVCRICFMLSNRAPSLVESKKTISISDWKALPFSPLHVG